MNTKTPVRWITTTAAFVALLIVAQAATVPLGNTLVTGSLVNLILVVSVMICGLSSGLCVAAISPIMAKLIGIGPLWSLIPFIMLGNVTLVLLWYILGNRSFGGKQMTAYIVALIAAAVAKFLVLYVGIVQIAIPYLLNLPEKQATVISGTFSVPQLITATIGGALAIVVLPILKKARSKGN